MKECKTGKWWFTMLSMAVFIIGTSVVMLFAQEEKLEVQKEKKCYDATGSHGNGQCHTESCCPDCDPRQNNQHHKRRNAPTGNTAVNHRADARDA